MLYNLHRNVHIIEFSEGGCEMQPVTFTCGSKIKQPKLWCDIEAYLQIHGGTNQYFLLFVSLQVVHVLGQERKKTVLM